MHTPLLLIWLLAAGFLAQPAHAAVEMGTIISLTPSVQAEREGRKEEMHLKSVVYKADVLHSGPTGKAQILLLDDTTIAIAPGTQAGMEEFALDGGNSSFVMQLGHGLARVVTGSIVDANPDGFKIVTPRAHIGVRGTDVTIMDDGITTTVISNTIHKRNILVTNRATGEVTAISKSGMAVEATGAGNLLRQATPEERARATQATRRDPPTLFAVNTKTATGGGSGGSGGADSGKDTAKESSRTASNRYSRAASTGTTLDVDTASWPLFAQTEPNLNLKDKSSLPGATPPPVPNPDPVPPTPNPDPVPPPLPDPDPVPPVPPTPEPDPVPPTPEPDPVPPTPDPDPEPPVPPTPEPDPVPPTPSPDPDPPVPPIVPPRPPVVPPSPPSPPTEVGGGFSGALAGSARSGTIGGTFQLEVTLSSGAITKGSMEINDNSLPVFAAYGGTGTMSGRNFAVTSWGKVLGQDGSLRGTFSDAATLTSVAWDAEASDSIGWSGSGGSFTQVPENTLTEKAPPDTASIVGWHRSTGTNNFQFQVDAEGKITDAHLRIGKDSYYIFEGYKGTGLIRGNTFNVFNWGYLAAGKSGSLNGQFVGSAVDSATWSVVDAADNSITNTFSVFASSPTGTPGSPNPQSISGGFKGTLSEVTGPGTFNHGDFQFNVALDTGIVSGASLRGFSSADDSVQLFGAYGGNGRMETTVGFLVSNWEGSSSDDIRLHNAVFGPTGALTSIQWKTPEWVGAGINFAGDPSGYTPLTRPAAGHFSGSLQNSGGANIGTYDLNVDLATGAITHAALSSSSDNFAAIGGTGTITGNAFTVDSFLGDTDTRLQGAVNTNAPDIVQTLTGITWTTRAGTTVHTGDALPGTFSSDMTNKSPNHIQGTFRGTAAGATHDAEIAFTVNLGTGTLSANSLNVYPTGTPGSPVFTGTGGTGGIISPTDYTFAVTGLADGGTPSLAGQFDGRFTSAGGGNIDNWKVIDGSGTPQYNGTNMPFAK